MSTKTAIPFIMLDDLFHCTIFQPLILHTPLTNITYYPASFPVPILVEVFSVRLLFR